MKTPWWDVASRGLRRVILRACNINEFYVREPWEMIPVGFRKEILEKTELVKAEFKKTGLTCGYEKITKSESKLKK